MSQAAVHRKSADFEHLEELSFVRKYVFSSDHKTIAKQYLGISLFMAMVGGFTAYAIRWQLAWPSAHIPGMGVITPDAYNTLVTMHGTIMVFFVAMPLLLGVFGNFCIPLMVGAGDMAFPRLNMVSVWTLFVGALILFASFFVPGGAAAAGWTAYAPLSANPSLTPAVLGQDMWILALALEFSSFLMGGVNFVTTALNMRAPGMGLWRLPLLVWYEITASVLFLLSVGPLIGGAVMLLLDRLVGAGFFLPAKGGDPLLWEHLFWFFGHPEVYVVALPGFGIMLEILPVFARKPDLRLSRTGVLRADDDRSQSNRLGASHVHQRNGPETGDSVHRYDDSDLGAVRGDCIRDDRDAVGRRHQVRHTDAVRTRWPYELSARRRDRHFPRFGRDRHIPARNLLCRGALPLHAFPGHVLRRVRGTLLLVPEDVRAHDERDLGQGTLLGDDARVPGRVPSAVSLRNRRNTAPRIRS